MLSVATNGRVLCGRYTLLEKLGAGGQAEVWRAHDGTRGVDIALKVLDLGHARSEAAWQALEREHAITSRLDHPAILKVYPPERDGDIAVLPMELALGGDLRRLRGASYLDIVPVLIVIAEALEHAHERGVVHRDLKPSNVLFDSRGRVRVADFGAAGTTALGASIDPAKGTLSPFTASPEQLRGEPPALTDDIYGLGALAYELLSGYPPHYPRFELKRVLEEPVAPLKPAQQIPPLLESLVMRMLDKQAHKRPQSMREVIDELDAALNDTLTFEFDPVVASLGGASAAVQSPPTLHPEPRTETFTVAPAIEEAAPVARRAPAPPPSPTAAAMAAVSAKSAAARQPVITDTPVADARPRAPEVSPPSVQVPKKEQAPKKEGRAEPTITATPTVPRSTEKQPVHDWRDIKIERVPGLLKAERVRTRNRRWLALAVLVAVAVAVFVWLPQFAPRDLVARIPSTLSTLTPTPPGSPARSEGPERIVGQAEQPEAAVAQPPVAGSANVQPPSAEGAAADGESPPDFEELRTKFEERLAALDKRAAGRWGGREFGDARIRAAEAVGAFDAGNPALASERMNQALALLDKVESRANQALGAQITAGERALDAGQSAAAVQAFELALRIDPRSTRAQRGLRRARNLDQVLPLLASAQNAESQKDFARAIQDYSKALELDPDNARAKEGLARANSAFGDDAYASAVGAGFAALGAGRLEEAQAAFEKARRIRPNGREAADGLARVGAALRSRGFAASRQRALALEAEERWAEAVKEYEAVLKVDPTLTFAQQGRARAAARAELDARLQQLIDRPEQLAAPEVREEALALIERARQQEPFGPVLRSQVTRLEILLPEFDKPVRVALVSDNVTHVSIQRVGSFGTFARREIELKPGKYTVVGTRVGYRDVRRDITIAPGQDIQTISVSCVEPI